MGNTQTIRNVIHRSTLLWTALLIVIYAVAAGAKAPLVQPAASNSDAQLTAVNVRLRYIYRPNSDLYVIYNQTTGGGLEAPSYSLQVKLTYDFTF